MNTSWNSAAWLSLSRFVAGCTSRPLRMVLTMMLGLVLAPALGAPTPLVIEIEIDHLLAYIGDSGCQFYRNGSWYSPDEAQSHLNRKYGYITLFGSVKSAEDFIEKAASESSETGERYVVKCGDAPPVSSALWLAEELARYRLRATQPPVLPGHL